MQLGRIATALAIPFGAALAFAAPASAAAPSAQAAASPPSACYGGYSYDGGAFACFAPYGEHLWVCDTGLNHHPVVNYAINGGSYSGNRHYYPGNGNCVDIDLDIAETGYITFTIANYEGSTFVSGSRLYEVPAGD
ncbi:hypothetical protein ACQPZK_15570 [Micromonospora sp. CA-249363]|jgi:hypothetical protein|uniref:hypothetical protein n=1 Tax=Micromonospora sp. CA-249363 TaxID=3239963 RepID=UPI003D8C119B